MGSAFRSGAFLRASKAARIPLVFWVFVLFHEVDFEDRACLFIHREIIPDGDLFARGLDFN